MPDHGSYAPIGIERDTGRAESHFGLVGSRVTAPWGSAYARHLPIRRGDVATVFLHGASGSWTGWTPLLEAAGRQNIPLPEPVLIDLPGWGDGVLRASVLRLTIHDICTLVGAVLDRLGYTRWHLVGHSMGGLIALHLAATSPERVVAVGVVSGTSFSVIQSVEHPLRQFWSVPAFTMLWRVMGVLRSLGAVGRSMLRAATALGIMRVVFAPLFRHGFRVPRSVVLATVDGIDPHAFLAAAEVVRGYDAATLWTNITCPVNALSGDRDVFVGAHDLEELAQTVRHAVISVIAECGHFALIEWPHHTLVALGFTSVTEEAADPRNSPS